MPLNGCRSRSRGRIRNMRRAKKIDYDHDHDNAGRYRVHYSFSALGCQAVTRSAKAGRPLPSTDPKAGTNNPEQDAPATCNSHLINTIALELDCCRIRIMLCPSLPRGRDAQPDYEHDDDHDDEHEHEHGYEHEAVKPMGWICSQEKPL